MMTEGDDPIGRCMITGNPCGTDARKVGCPCPCWRCQQWLSALNAHRTAIDLVLAMLRLAKATWAHGADPLKCLVDATKSIEAMRDWTPEHAAEVLRETKGEKL